MTNGTTEMVFILDRSGSMSGLESDTIGGFNSMIEKQKQQPGKAYVTTVLFDTEIKTIHDRIPLEEVPAMTGQDYFVGGCTALLDAIGTTVSHIDSIHKYARKEDVPAHTVFAITTDGMENASREYGLAAVKKLIEKHKEQGWEFLFIGANIDAVETAGRFGIDADRAVNYKADEKGTRVVYAAMCEAVESVRLGKKLKASWSDGIAKDCKERS
ncbi:MAG: VWA domain-containing protein [Clostridia bacterium]|nr:VWA domain-containing protein [Clostridia bacterium]